MKKEDWGVHESHCCKRHGCKYGDKDCPVVSGEAMQDYSCEIGSDFGQDCFENEPNAEEILKQETEKVWREAGFKAKHLTHQGIINAMKRYGKELLNYHE